MLTNAFTVHYNESEHPDYPGRGVSIAYRLGVVWQVDCRCGPCSKLPDGVGHYIPKWRVPADVAKVQG